MITSEIKTVNRPDGEICRLQLVRLQDWESLDFLRPQPAEDALAGLLRIYRQFLVPAAPWIFGQMALFRLPEEEGMRQLSKLPVFSGAESLSAPQERLFAAVAVLRQGMQLRRGKPHFLTEEAKSLWTHLSSSGCADTVCGRLPFTKILPVSGQMGFLSACEKDASLKVNASFFIMDPFDCAAPFDSIGTPFGLCVKDGRVLSPPLYEREALLVKKNGAVSVRTVSLNGLTIRLCGRVFEPAKNAEVLTRLSCKKTRKGSVPELVITGNRVRAVSLTGGLSVPASGFVLRSPGLYGLPVSPGDPVTYHGLEDILFGIQVGSSLLKDGARSKGFLSPFYNIRRPWKPAFPPSLYPLDYEKARAARIALGADREGRPMLLWAEGAPKIGHQKGKTSCGASLSEMEEYCLAAGMRHAVNLDGGGSAQILIDNQRQLAVSDRLPDGSELERPVPLGLIFRQTFRAP